MSLLKPKHGLITVALLYVLWAAATGQLVKLYNVITGRGGQRK